MSTGLPANTGFPCRMQLSGLSGMDAFDPAEILYESLGIKDKK
jgi:hypothetical protein